MQAKRNAASICSFLLILGILGQQSPSPFLFLGVFKVFPSQLWDTISLMSPGSALRPHSGWTHLKYLLLETVGRNSHQIPEPLYLTHFDDNEQWLWAPQCKPWPPLKESSRQPLVFIISFFWSHPSVNCYLIMMKEFECLKDHRSHVGGSSLALVGAPMTNWLSKCDSESLKDEHLQELNYIFQYNLYFQRLKLHRLENLESTTLPVRFSHKTTSCFCF